MTATIIIKYENSTVERTLTVGPTDNHAEMQIECAAGPLAADVVNAERQARKLSKSIQ